LEQQMGGLKAGIGAVIQNECTINCILETALNKNHVMPQDPDNVTANNMSPPISLIEVPLI